MKIHRRLPPERMYPAGVRGVVARFVDLPSGETIRVAESGPPNGIPVLLVHGWGGCIYSFRAALPALAAAGHRAIAVDLHGHGLSSKANVRGGYDLSGMVHHLGEIVDALGIENLVIAGHSMSGRVALEYACAFPERVRGLALLGAAGVAPLRVPVPLIRPALALAARAGPITVRRFAVRLVMRVVYGTLRPFTEADVDEYWAPSRFPRYGRALHALLRDFDWGVVDPARIALLPMPVVIVEGELDPLLGVRDAASLARSVSPKRVASIARAGHIITDEAAEQVNDELLGLVALSAKRMAPRVTIA
jgi:2-hydroxy-6-oxonona-2,4-dienedioate hydrolase